MRAEGYSESLSPFPPRADVGWLGRLELGFEQRGGRSIVARNVHQGPLRIQRPFYPEGVSGACHVYLLHPPGGVVGSDRLELSVRADAGSRALITTPGAGKLYRTRGPVASLTQRAEVSAGACLELLPQETIAFRGTDARLETHVDLASGASAVGWDILCLGRPASGETFDAGRVRQRIELWRNRRRLWFERAEYLGGTPRMHEPWGLGGHSVVGTWWCVPADEEALRLVRRACADQAERVAFTRLGDVLVGRRLAKTAAHVRQAFERAWLAWRAHMGRPGAARPRVWNT